MTCRRQYAEPRRDGMFAIMVRLGLGPEEIRQRQISFAVVRAETDFHHELRPGDVMALEPTVLTLGEKSATSLPTEKCGDRHHRNEHGVQMCAPRSRET